MADDVNEEVEVNENPESVEDLTDDQLDEMLAKSEVTPEGDLNFDEELTVPEEPDPVKPAEGKGDDGDDEDPDPDPDSDPDPDDDDNDVAPEDPDGDDNDEDDELAGLDPKARATMEKVLQRLEVMETEREMISAELDRERMLRDRNAGKLGSLMQKLEKSRDDNDASASDDDADGSTETKSQDAGEEALALVRKENVVRAMDGASLEFYTQNEAFFNALTKEAGAEANESFQADLVTKVQEHQKSLGEDMLAMSPKMAAKLSETILRSAFADVKLSFLKDFQTKAGEKSEESRRNIRARKKGAAGARSNKSPTAKKSTTKSLSQMSEKELDAELARVASSFD